VGFLHRLLKMNIPEEQTSSTSQKPVRHMSDHSWLIILLGVLLIVGLWVFAWQQINYDYDRTIQETSHEAMNLTKSLEEHVRRVVASADKDLSNLKKAYERGGISSPVLVDNVKTAADGLIQKQVAVLNEQGIIVSAYFENRLGMDVSDREYFNVHRDVDTDMIYIGRPMIGSNNGQSIIPLSRRINKPDGSFGGVVVLGLQTEYLLQFYQKIDLGPNSLISLIGMDGVVRARQANLEVGSGQDVTDSYLWKSILTRPNGTAIANTAQDAGGLITSYRVMPDYPLVVTVGESIQVALADHEKRKQGYIIGASLASLFIVFTCILLFERAAKQRSRLTELARRIGERTQELQEQKDQLSEANHKLAETSATVQQEKDRLSALINSMSDEVWFADTQKRLTLVNPQTRQEFSNAVSAATNIEELFTCFGVLRPDWSPRPIEESPTLRALQGEVIKNQQEIGRSSATGAYCYREVNANPIKDAEGKIIGAVGVARDITERKQMENDLIQHRDNLERLVRERTEEVLRLDRFNLVGEMAAGIGHEVRNPLTTVRGYLQLFQRKEKMA